MKKYIFLLVCFLSGVCLEAQITDSIYRTIDRIAQARQGIFPEQLEKQASLFEQRASSTEEYMALLILRCNMGYYYRNAGMPIKAIDSYEKAWKNYREHNLPEYDIIEYGLKPLGNLYTKSGNFTQAENTIKSYLFLAEEQDNQPQKIAAVLNLSVVYHNTGNFRTAIRLLEDNLRYGRPDPEQKALLLNNLATNYFAIGSYHEADTALGDAARISPQVTAPMYRNMAQMARGKAQWEQAAVYLDHAEQALKTTPFSARDLALLYVEKADLSKARRDTITTRKLLYKALDFLLPDRNPGTLPYEDNIYAESALIPVFDALAALEEDMETALDYYELAFYVTALLQQQMTSQETKILHSATNRTRSEKCISLLYNAYKNTGNSRYLERAFTYAERSKAAVLKDAIALKSLAEKFPGDSLIRQEQKFSALREHTVNSLIRAQLTGQKQDSVPFYTETLNELNLSLKSLKQQIVTRYPENAFNGISTTLLQEKLAEDKANMIVYFSGVNYLYTFVFTHTDIALYRKTKTPDYEKKLKQFLSFFDSPDRINNDVATYSKSAYELFRSLLPDDIPYTPYLVIVPDGLLHFVPFGALLTTPARNDNYMHMDFLTRRQKLVYQTSADLYFHKREHPKNERLLGIFPVFENSASELRYSEEEAGNIRHIMKGDMLCKSEATKANFIKKAGNYDIIHLSTHASGGSFVVPAHIQFRDDILLLQELYGMHLNPGLVVLSACETGIGKLQHGEGAMSIARGFQYAGTERLLFSLWKVNDRATATLMDMFYKNYEKYASACSASQQAGIDYLENPKIPLARKSPYYWAGFVYYGHIEQEKLPYASRTTILCTFVLLFCVVIGIELYRKNKRKKFR
ncbi:CHAT domain-containing protein [Sinomicrobium oceani]|uniref:CHAT domain-containing protein n=1 Tax=Sinomicrobium oceani TaxID=1150368 RepID=UPI00227C08CE|nr:CHAT domain-containing tetratricopeptide repeat protein [Sinomicrobium oceani]